MEKINWICKSDTINNTIVWSCRPKNIEHFDSIENFESSSDKMIGVKVSLKNVSTGGILADGSEGTIIKVANDSQPYLVARIDTPDVIWWYTQNDLKFPSTESLLVLSRLQRENENPNSPGLLMTMNGTDWFVPNIPGKKSKERAWVAKLNNTYYINCGPWEKQVLYSSTDLKNWQPIGPDFDKFGNAIISLVAYDNKLYLGVYDRGRYSSTDGINWTKISDDGGSQPIVLNGKFLVGSNTVNQLDANFKVTKASPSLGGGGYFGINSIAYDSDKDTYLVSCSQQGDDGSKKLLFWSNDLVNWTPATGNWQLGKYSGFSNLTKAFGKWWVRGGDATLLMCSDDAGRTWYEVKPPANSYGSLFKMGDALFYWGLDNPKDMFYSMTDGKNWQKITTPNVLMNGGWLEFASII